VRLELKGAKLVTEPLKQPHKRARRSAPSAGEAPGASDSASNASDEETLTRLTTDFQKASDAESTGGSVDTDADSEFEDEIFAARELVDDALASDLEDPGAEEDPDADDEGAEPAPKRHAPGTWVVWSNAWFYITHPPRVGGHQALLPGRVA